MGLRCFDQEQVRVVEEVRSEAERLVSRFYALSARELSRIHYEVKTLQELQTEEITDQAFAQLICYDYTRSTGSHILQHYELYRICLQDHVILEAACDRPEKLDLPALLLYVLAHELVHTVRFAQRLQRFDVVGEERQREEQIVERTAWKILGSINAQPIRRVREVLSVPSMIADNRGTRAKICEFMLPRK